MWWKITAAVVIGFVIVVILLIYGIWHFLRDDSEDRL